MFKGFFLLPIAALIGSGAQHEPPLYASRYSQHGSRNETHPTARSKYSPVARERVRRLEAGLVPAILIKGQPPPKMNLVDRMKHYKVPGVSIAVINNYRIEWAQGYGVVEAKSGKPVTTQTLFQGGSISKPVTAVAALRLVEDGKLQFDRDVNEKLISWKVPQNQFTEVQKVTLRRILSHTAGLSNSGVGEYSCDDPKPTLLQALDGFPPAKNPATRVLITPGTRWSYSGGGYTVLQQLMIDVTGKHFEQLIDETIFARLKMRHSTFRQPPFGRSGFQFAVAHQSDGKKFKCPFSYPEMAAAGISSTPSDLARLIIDIQKVKTGSSRGILSPQMVERMLTPQFDNGALGFFISGEGKSRRFSHGGGNQGFFSYMVGYADTGQGAVVMVNGTDYWELVHEIIRGIALEYGWSGYLRERSLAKVDSKRLAELVGRYEVSPDWILTLVDQDGRLILMDDRSELLPESDREFFMMDGREFNFTTDDAGNVNGLVMRRNDFIIRARKLRA
jgi:CubicO group peptidase (beta-lactamase class C family)